MKFLFAQPAKKRFAWELHTVINSLSKLGVDKKDIILLFAKEDDSVLMEFNDSCDEDSGRGLLDVFKREYYSFCLLFMQR